jgi:hypothetical protein
VPGLFLLHGFSREELKEDRKRKRGGVWLPWGGQEREKLKKGEGSLVREAGGGAGGGRDWEDISSRVVFATRTNTMGTPHVA